MKLQTVCNDIIETRGAGRLILTPMELSEHASVQRSANTPPPKIAY